MSKISHTERLSCIISEHGYETLINTGKDVYQNTGYQQKHLTPTEHGGGGMMNDACFAPSWAPCNH